MRNPMLGVLNLIDPHIAWPHELDVTSPRRLLAFAEGLLGRAHAEARNLAIEGPSAGWPSHRRAPHLESLGDVTSRRTVAGCSVSLLVMDATSRATSVLEPAWTLARLPLSSMWPEQRQSLRHAAVAGLTWSLLYHRPPHAPFGVEGRGDASTQLVDATKWTLKSWHRTVSASEVVTLLSETGWTVREPDTIEQAARELGVPPERLYQLDFTCPVPDPQIFRGSTFAPQVVRLLMIAGKAVHDPLSFRIGDTPTPVTWEQLCTAITSGHNLAEAMSRLLPDDSALLAGSPP